jgi:hypothetical protein
MVGEGHAPLVAVLLAKPGESPRVATPKARSASSTVFPLQIGRFSRVATGAVGLCCDPPGLVGGDLRRGPDRAQPLVSMAVAALSGLAHQLPVTSQVISPRWGLRRDPGAEATPGPHRQRIRRGRAALVIRGSTPTERVFSRVEPLGLARGYSLHRRIANPQSRPGMAQLLRLETCLTRSPSGVGKSSRVGPFCELSGPGRLPNAERFRGSRPETQANAPTGALPSGRFGRGGSRPLRPKGSFEPGHAYLLPWAWRAVSLPQASAAKSRLTITCVA